MSSLLAAVLSHAEKVVKPLMPNICAQRQHISNGSKILLVTVLFSNEYTNC